MAEVSPTTRELVRSLQEQLRGWERDHRGPAEIVSTGSPALDRLLPDGGFCRGTSIEWLAANSEEEKKVSGTEFRNRGKSRQRNSHSVPDTFFCGSGAATLALAIACRACHEAGALVVVDRPRMFYPPAAAGLAIDWKWFVLVRPRNDRDEAWALDQVLRSPGVGSVLCWPQKLTERRFRQMQLAAEAGGTLCLLVRPEKARDESSWAEMRLSVACQGIGVGALAASFTTRLRRRLRVEMIRLRGGAAGGSIELELDEQTGTLHEPSAVDLAPRLAAPAAGRRSTGA
jgi:protein ImuA